MSFVGALLLVLVGIVYVEAASTRRSEEGMSGNQSGDEDGSALCWFQYDIGTTTNGTFVQKLGIENEIKEITIDECGFGTCESPGLILVSSVVIGDEEGTKWQGLKYFCGTEDDICNPNQQPSCTETVVKYSQSRTEPPAPTASNAVNTNTFPGSTADSDATDSVGFGGPTDGGVGFSGPSTAAISTNPTTPPAAISTNPTTPPDTMTVAGSHGDVYEGLYNDTHCPACSNLLESTPIDCLENEAEVERCVDGEFCWKIMLKEPRNMLGSLEKEISMVYMCDDGVLAEEHCNSGNLDCIGGYPALANVANEDVHLVTSAPITPTTAEKKSTKPTIPDVATPEAAIPKTILTKAATPVIINPEATTPGVVIPEATTTKATTPEATTPEATTPEATTPEATTAKAATTSTGREATTVHHDPSVSFDNEHCPICYDPYVTLDDACAVDFDTTKPCEEEKFCVKRTLTKPKTVLSNTIENHYACYTTGEYNIACRGDCTIVGITTTGPASSSTPHPTTPHPTIEYGQSACPVCEREPSTDGCNGDVNAVIECGVLLKEVGDCWRKLMGDGWTYLCHETMPECLLDAGCEKVQLIVSDLPTTALKATDPGEATTDAPPSDDNNTEDDNSTEEGEQPANNTDTNNSTDMEGPKEEQVVNKKNAAGKTTNSGLLIIVLFVFLNNC